MATDIRSGLPFPMNTLAIIAYAIVLDTTARHAPDIVRIKSVHPQVLNDISESPAADGRA